TAVGRGIDRRIAACRSVTTVGPTRQRRLRQDLGVLELLAAVGLILPAVADIAPVMLPVTGVCWALLMIGAMITHGRLGQFKFVMLNSVYFARWRGHARRASTLSTQKDR